MLEGIRIKPLKKRPDERGFFLEVLRNDWKDLLEDEIVQANLSISYPGIVRAWHQHQRGQVDYFMALKGSIKICAYDAESGELDEIVSTEHNPQIVRIPGIYWHGFKVISHEPAWLLYFVNKLYDYEKPDETHKPWDDKNIIPKSINGRTDDIRVARPWNWSLSPSK